MAAHSAAIIAIKKGFAKANPNRLFNWENTKYPFGVSSHHTVCVADSFRSTDLRLLLSEVIALSGILDPHGGE